MIKFTPMLKLFVCCFLLSSVLLAQSLPASLEGAWKADLNASKFAGPPVSKYLEIIEEGEFPVNPPSHQTNHGIKELIGSWSEEGGRELLTFTTSNSLIVPFEGVTARITAIVQNRHMEVRAEVPGGPIAEHRSYQLSDDGMTLTIQTDQYGFGPVEHSNIVLRRQMAAAVEELRRPEEKAGAVFKNIQTTDLKNLQASELMNRMHYYSWALNKRCNFCHVMPFDADKKDQKKVARKMIDMTAAMNQTALRNTPIDCFTCHQFRSRPLLRPLFSEEISKERQGESRDPTTLMNGIEKTSSMSTAK